MPEMKRITLYTSEKVRWQGVSPVDFVTNLLRTKRIPARCMAWHGQTGYYENGEIATGRIEVISGNLPIKIEILLSGTGVPMMLEALKPVAHDSILTLDELHVVAGGLRIDEVLGRSLVADLMTQTPKSVQLETPLQEVVDLLLQADLHAMPVVNEFDLLKGILTQGDLIGRAGMPVRLGLLQRLREGSDLDWARGKRAAGIMTADVVSIRPEQTAAEAISLMLRRQLKRLPVVNEHNKLVGILSRRDILQAALSVSEDEPEKTGSPTTQDAVLTSTPTVLPETSFLEVLRALDHNNVQRLAVVDAKGCFLGMIFDHDLLPAFGVAKGRVLQLFAEKVWRRRESGAITTQKKAQELMHTQIVTVNVKLPVEMAMRIMAVRGYKRLPVVDDVGKFVGMLSRDALLRANNYH